MFDPAEFFRAFSKHGLLRCAHYIPPSGPTYRFMVGWVRPDELLLSEQVQSTEYLIEYETAGAPVLEPDMRLTIDGEAYVVRAPPRARGDGSFTTATLAKVRR